MKRKVLALLVAFCITLSSCAPAIIAGAAGTAIIYDKRSLNTIYQDEEITHQVTRAIKNNPNLKNSHINAIALNKVVLLVGQTRSQQEKNQSQEIAHSIPGVKHIYNQIEINEQTSPKTRSKDAWITTKVKAALFTDQQINSSSIKVITENSVTYLLGIVDKQQADFAISTTRKINGVKKVVNLFQITKLNSEKNGSI